MKTCENINCQKDKDDYIREEPYRLEEKDSIGGNTVYWCLDCVKRDYKYLKRESIINSILIEEI